MARAPVAQRGEAALECILASRGGLHHFRLVREADGFALEDATGRYYI